MEMDEKVVVVTGASRGIGRRIAEALVAEGARVYGFARGAEGLEAVREDLGEAFTPVPCDVTEPEAVRAAVETVRDDAGRIDALVNNAGLGRYDELEALSLDDWSVQLDTNLTGVFLCTKAVVPTMKAQNADSGFGGHIVNIASIAGLIGNPTLSAYNASKFGLRGFSDALMKELRDDGIKVSCIYPGSVATGFGGKDSDNSGSRSSRNPMQPEDIASTVVHVLKTPENYLISEVVMRPLRPRG